MRSGNATDLVCSATRDRPIYIVDGAAGAEPTMSSPTSPLTLFKEFARWGYSRMIASPTSLELRHYSAPIAADGISVDLPYSMTDSVKLDRKE